MCALTIGNTFAALQSSTTIDAAGYILNDVSINYTYRIADFMVDILPPNMNSQSYANAWQDALNDLKTASPNGEITHVQMRTFWKTPGDTGPDLDDASSWNYPEEGAYDTYNLPRGQMGMAANWQSWIFGDPAPTYDCAAKRIHDAGLKVEFCLGGCWGGTDTIAGMIPVFHEDAEADYPSFNGTTFLTNYMDDILRPMAQFLASNDNFQNGDIFMLTFENWYHNQDVDFAWNHSDQWISMIEEIRQIFANAGKSGVLLTMDNTGWWDDFGLGATGLQVLIDAGLAEDNQFDVGDTRAVGMSGCPYYSYLDFLSVSSWIGLLLPEQVPETWDESHVKSLIVPAWHNVLRFDKAGTGHGMIPAEEGRDLINDYWAVSQALGVPVLTNCGWTNGHSHLASSNPAGGSGGAYDQMAQKVAWMAQIRALGGDSRGWCCGQDFERYCENKASGTSVNTSWRNAPAQTAIIDEIRSILNP